MKKGPVLIFISFIIFIYCPCIIWLIAGDRSSVSQNEKRRLSSMPRFSIENYDMFSKDFEDYFDDHMPCRDTLISLDSNLNYYLFHQVPIPSDSGAVIIGKDNWLFYGTQSDGDPIDDYMGRNLLTEDELDNLKNNCQKIERDLKKEGCQFIIFVAPNKERTYSEFMPGQYGAPAENYRALQIINYLRENTDVQIIYPYDELMKVKAEINDRLYYKTDTHWNNIGSYVGTRVLLQKLDVDIPDIYSNQLKIERNGYHNGDLAQMLNMTAQMKKNDYDYLIEGYDTHNIQKLLVENAQAYTSSNSDQRRLYVYHDSFGNAMAPYIKSQFFYAYFIHKNEYTYEDFKKQQSDVFIYETVERYIDDLATFTIYK